MKTHTSIIKSQNESLPFSANDSYTTSPLLYVVSFDDCSYLTLLSLNVNIRTVQMQTLRLQWHGTTLSSNLTRPGNFLNYKGISLRKLNWHRNT
jgi:hypothetical protein